MVVLCPKDIEKYHFAINHSQVQVTVANLAELVLQERDPGVAQKGYDVLLEFKGKKVYDTYTVGFFAEKKEAEQEYRHYQTILHSGNYELILNIGDKTAEIKKKE